MLRQFITVTAGTTPPNSLSLVLVLVTFVGVLKSNLVSSDTNLATITPPTASTIINNNTAPKASNSSSSSSPTSGAITISEQLQLGGKCAIKSTCKQRGRRLELDGGSDKRSCYCDDKCFQYDDCCLDSAWSKPFKQRIDLGLERLRQARKQWHCHRVNPIFGGILLRATCSAEWLAQHDNQELAQQVRRRCEYVKDRGKLMSGDMVVDYQTDPVGMMMPITDLSSGVTYANSYCLRCNRLRRPPRGQQASRQQQVASTPSSPPSSPLAAAPGPTPKLIYWSPLLTCNYNLETDERNTLYDLISANKGQVLKYSSKRNKWIIDATKAVTANFTNTTITTTTISPAAADSNSDDDGDDEKNERVCSITPTIPDSVEHIIRYCRANTIDTCLPNRKPARMDANRTSQYESQRRECEFGHQALVYSQTSDLVYFNLACAKCNQEKQVFCEPKLKKDLGSGGSKWSISSVGQDNTKILSAPTETTSDDSQSGIMSISSSEDPPSGGSVYKEGPRGGDASATAAGEAKSSTAISGSFSILIDLYGSSQGDEQVGAIHQCPDMENQVYDPFHNVCRDIVCGLKHYSVDGKCVEVKGEDQVRGVGGARVDVVDKFKPAMVYLTTVCLIISIASLSLYLALYCLSMLDLRKLVVDMAQANCTLDNHHHQMDKQRASKCSSNSVSGSTAGGSRGSQSLSSRGVACLAASLLTAYLFFILGHQSNNTNHNLVSELAANGEAHSSSASGSFVVAQLHLTANATNNSNHQHQTNQPPRSVGLTCLALALGTYYCFLVAFNWMFLLSYDIWRTLRLATRQLRGPALHSQSKRFLSYTLFSLLVSGLIVAAATIVDQASPFECSETISTPNQQVNIHNHNCSSSQPPYKLWVNEFIHMYRPKFGQRAGSCWFSNRRSLALFFGMPVALIMFLNLLFFLHSSYMVIRTSTRSSRHKSSNSCSSTGNNPGQHQQQQQQQQFGSFGNSQEEPKLISVILHKNSIPSPSTKNTHSPEAPDAANYVHQNSLTTTSMMSVQTIQSQLSSSSCGDSSSSAEEFALSEESVGAPPQRPDGAPSPHSTPQAPPPLPPPTPPRPPPGHNSPQAIQADDPDCAKRSQLVSTQSSGSLTNQSIGGVSLSTSLASKYDSKVHQLSTVMGSVVKDYRLYCRLSTIMGLTWLTGLMASVVDQSDALWYVFVVLNTLQGLFIFIAFGCKRSKLNNLEILLNYVQFRWRQLGEKCTSRRKRKPSDNDDGDRKEKSHVIATSQEVEGEVGEGDLQKSMANKNGTLEITTRQDDGGE